MRRGRFQHLEECCIHVTHRCQEGRFLLRFKQDRRNYVRRLREAIETIPVDVLDYVVTSNHVHLLLWADDGGNVSKAMQYIQGTTARDYNRRKERRGTFWADRFHPTLIQTGPHLSRCLFYIGLNMVRARAVSHPSEWEGCGYAELAGVTEKPGIIVLDRLLWCLEMPGNRKQFREWYCKTMDELSGGYLAREPLWSEAAAVGDRHWIEKVAGRIAVGRRKILGPPEPTDRTVAVHEEPESYALYTGRRNKDMLIASC